MRDPERLYAAIGGAEPELLIRSEQKRRRRWPGYCLAAAACLALVLAAGHILLWRAGQGVMQPDKEDKTGKPPFETAGIDGAGAFLPPQGEQIGALRLLSYAPQSQGEAVDFLIYINEEQFYICEENGLYSIRNINTLPENFPECSLDILHLSATSPAEAKEAVEVALKSHYAEVFYEEKSDALPDSVYLRASNGVDWDSEQVELWFVNDGQGGAFLLTARYFLEAEEGVGACFRDMASSFRVISLNEPVPDWMRELYETTGRLFPALFSNDLSSVSSLLAKDSIVEAYGEDVWADTTVVSVDYALDNDQTPSQATVSVKHRLNQVEGDSFSYLTMYLLRQGGGGQWLLDWAGIEK